MKNKQLPEQTTTLIKLPKEINTQMRMIALKKGGTKNQVMVEAFIEYIKNNG